ncbi:MAG: hypothetical protein R3C11_01320 [Planctomycetaceae bacterium]
MRPDYRKTFLRAHILNALGAEVDMNSRDGIYSFDPTRDLLGMLDLRAKMEAAWRQVDIDERESLESFRKNLFSRTSPKRFFYGEAGVNLYRPVTIYNVDDPDEKWPELSCLIRALTDRKFENDQRDQSGILLTAGSGSGKTVAAWKAFFDCFNRPILPNDSETTPYLHDYLPCWVRSYSSVPYYKQNQGEDVVAGGSYRLILELIAFTVNMVDLTSEDSYASGSLDQIQLRLERYLQYGPSCLLFFDLNHVHYERERIQIATALNDFHHRYGGRHRCVVIYRPCRNDDNTFQELLKLKRFRQYDLIPLSEQVSVEYLKAIREVEGALYRELSLPNPSNFSINNLPDELFNAEELEIVDRRQRFVEWECRLLRTFIRKTARSYFVPISNFEREVEHGDIRNKLETSSLISIPLLMHWVSLLSGPELLNTHTLTNLYSKVVKCYLQREQLKQVSLSSVLNQNDSRIVTACTRLAFAILHQGSGTQLPIAYIKSLLANPQGTVANWWPKGSLFLQSSYATDIYDDGEIHRFLDLGIVRQEGEEIRFLHDSFIYYFAGAIGLREYISPGLPGQEQRLDPTWPAQTATLLAETPDRWVLPAEFLAGSLNLPALANQTLLQSSTPDARALVKELILAFPNSQLPDLLIRFLAELASDPLLRQIRYALLEYGPFIYSHPETILQQVYNHLRWCIANKNDCRAFAKELLYTYRSMPEPRAIWIRIADGPIKSSRTFIAAHTSRISFIIALNEHEIISGSDDGRLVRFAPNKGVVDESTMTTRCGLALGAKLSSNAIAVCNNRGSIIIYDWNLSSPYFLFQQFRLISRLIVVDGHWIVTGDFDGVLRVYNATNQYVYTAATLPSAITAMNSLSEDRFVTGLQNGEVGIHRIKYDGLSSEIVYRHTSDVSVIYSFDDHLLITGDASGTIILFDLEKHQYRQVITLPGCITSIVSVDRDRYFCCCEDRFIYGIDLKTDESEVVNTHLNMVTHLITVANRYVVSCGTDLTVRSYDIQNLSYIIARLDAEASCLSGFRQGSVIVGDETGRVFLFMRFLLQLTIYHLSFTQPLFAWISTPIIK